MSLRIHETCFTFVGFCQEAPKVGGVCDPLLGCDCPEGHECAIDLEDGVKFTCQKEEGDVTPTPAPQSLQAQVGKPRHCLLL